MTWGFLCLMFVLKIPIARLLWIVWWAVRSEPETEQEPRGDDGGTKYRPRTRAGRSRAGRAAVRTATQPCPRRRARAPSSRAPSASAPPRAPDPARWQTSPSMPRPRCSPTARSAGWSPTAASAIEPWDETMVQPASVDLRLGASFRVFHNHRVDAIDLADPPKNLTEQVEVGDGEPFVIHPGEFFLGRTRSAVELPDDIVARIEGKSSARAGSG